MRGRVWFNYTIKRKKMNSLNLRNKKITILKNKIGFSYSRIDNAVFQF